MSLLSDLTIRAYMPRGDLVRDGDPERAEGCGYTVVPGLAPPTGPGAMPVDFSADQRALVVPPGQMVWVRSRELVALPRTVAVIAEIIGRLAAA